jgi:PRTRC genetic system protein C
MTIHPAARARLPLQLGRPDRSGPAVHADQVRDFYAPTYPEILNAAIEGPEEKDGKLVYTFRRAVGTKGGSAPREPA